MKVSGIFIRVTMSPFQDDVHERNHVGQYGSDSFGRVPPSVLPPHFLDVLDDEVAVIPFGYLNYNINMVVSDPHTHTPIHTYTFLQRNVPWIGRGLFGTVRVMNSKRFI